MTRLFMRTCQIVNAALTLVGFLVGISQTPADAKASPPQPRAKNLVIVVANGIRYDDAFGQKMHLYTEKLWSDLGQKGTICTKLFNPGATLPLPSQASLLTGVLHKKSTPSGKEIHPAFPTLFEYWTKANGKSSSYFAANRKHYGILGHSSHAEYGEPLSPLFATATKDISGFDTTLQQSRPGISGNAIYEKAVAHIFTHHPSMVVLNLDSGSVEQGYPHDHEHPPGAGSEACEGEANRINAYYESIILTDTIVYDLWNRLEQDTVYKEKTVFIFVSTHGRNTTDFKKIGDNSRGCRQLNFLIIGPGIKKGFISGKKRSIVDICTTVGACFGIPVPFAKGAVMREIFE